MIEELATVTEIHQQGALVEVIIKRQSSCASCAQKSSCGSALWQQLFPTASSRLTISNKLNAVKGEQVIIGIQEDQFLRGVFSLYGIPMIVLLLLGLFGYQLTVLFNMDGFIRDLITLAFIILGFWGLKRFQQKRAPSNIQVTMLRRTPSNNKY